MNDKQKTKFKDELFALYTAYLDVASNATDAERLQAQVDDVTIGQEQLDAFLAKDFSDAYNFGDKVEDFPEPARTDYADFIEAFDLPEPTGKEPEVEFDIDDFFSDRED